MYLSLSISDNFYCMVAESYSALIPVSEVAVMVINDLSNPHAASNFDSWVANRIFRPKPEDVYFGYNDLDANSFYQELYLEIYRTLSRYAVAINGLRIKECSVHLVNKAKAILEVVHEADSRHIPR